MSAQVLAFAAGVLVLQLQPALPPVAWCWALPACVPAAAILTRARALAPRAFSLALCTAVGFLWALFMAHGRMDDRLPSHLEGRDLEIVGVVSSLPSVAEPSVRFELDVESAPEGVPRRIQLAW